MSKSKRLKVTKKPETQSKLCPVCQLYFNNRKRWESRGLWPSVKYCSEKCRRLSASGTNETFGSGK